MSQQKRDYAKGQRRSSLTFVNPRFSKGRFESNDESFQGKNFSQFIDSAALVTRPAFIHEGKEIPEGKCLQLTGESVGSDGEIVVTSIQYPMNDRSRVCNVLLNKLIMASKTVGWDGFYSVKIAPSKKDSSKNTIFVCTTGSSSASEDFFPYDESIRFFKGVSPITPVMDGTVHLKDSSGKPMYNTRKFDAEYEQHGIEFCNFIEGNYQIG